MRTHTLQRSAVVPGDLLDARYLIEREVGAGGMATVFLAHDLAAARPVAVKVMHSENASETAFERFENEVATLGRLRHPSIVALLDDGEVDGMPYYVMPYIDGETLRQRLDREGRLAIGEALRIAATIAGALDYAHRAGVIHRDLKPENILLSGPEVVVADFGVAFVASDEASIRMTQFGASIGTPQYMSPEQAAGEETLDCRSDIYSIAVLLYEMLTGIAPHSGATARAVIARILTVEPRPVTELRDVPAPVASALAIAMAKAPEGRFSSARDLALAIAA
jgi:serine/threonine protein kinase